jgi:hypothetical protein
MDFLSLSSRFTKYVAKSGVFLTSHKSLKKKIMIITNSSLDKKYKNLLTYI